MSSLSPLATIEKPGDASIQWTIHILESTGLKVLRTFDLQEARLSQSDCPCPHHGTEACDCQMCVLLVYETDVAPTSLLLHSFEDTTWLYLVDTPGQPVDQNVGSLIREILARNVAEAAENGE